MAEVFAVASGVAGLISLTIEVFGISYRYVAEVRSASESVRRFLSELESLKEVLLKIERLSKEIGNVEILGDGASTLLSADDSNKYVELLTTIRMELVDRLPNGSFRRKVKALTWPFSEGRTNALVDSLHRHLGIYKTALAADNLTTSRLTLSEVRHSRKSHDEAHISAVLDWLSPLNMYQKQHDTLSRRHGGTGSWLLSEPAFQSWMQSDNSPRMLWCPGDPGTGKTVMTSIIVDYLTRIYESDDVRVAYVYCDYKDQALQTASNLIACLARQVVGHPTKLPVQLEFLYTELKRQQRRPSVLELKHLLADLCGERKKTYVIVDALDECEHERRDFLPLLESLPHGSTRILITSRPYSEDIHRFFLSAPRITITASDADIKQFVQEQMEDRTDFLERTTSSLRDLITDKVCSRASGMFLFAVLQLNRICEARTVKKIKIALDSMSRELDQLYQQTIERIRSQKGDDGELGMRVLSWVTHARRPLNVVEIQHALAVEVDEVEEPSSDLDFDNILSPQSLTDLCAGLVVIEANSQIIRLVHQTTQEFFDKERQILFQDAELDISRVCLTYLSYDVASELPTYDYMLKTRAKYRFMEYAASFWFSHLQGSKDCECHGPTLKRAIAYVKDNRKILFLAKLLLHNRLPSRYLEEIEADHLARRDSLPLEAAAQFGLLELVKFLVAHNESSRGVAALVNALREATMQHIAVVHFLLTQDPLAAYDNEYLSMALKRACLGGPGEIAKLLISHKVDVNLWDDWEKLALHYAAFLKNPARIALLLREGANPFLQDPLGNTACHIAALSGHSGTVSLFTQGTNPNQWPVARYRDTVLHAAARGGDLDTVSLLLSRGFDPLARGRGGKTAREMLLSVGKHDPAEVEVVFLPYTQESYRAEVPTKESSTADRILESSEDHNQTHEDEDGLQQKI